MAKGLMTEARPCRAAAVSAKVTPATRRRRQMMAALGAAALMTSTAAMTARAQGVTGTEADVAADSSREAGRPDCPDNGNLMAEAPCPLSIDEGQARALIQARLVLAGRTDLAVAGIMPTDDGAAFAVEVHDGSGRVAGVFEVGARTGLVDQVR